MRATGFAPSLLALSIALATAAGSRPALAADAGPIDPAALSATVRTLASDAFEGRAPGTAGETKTVDYLIARFKAAGLEPGGVDGGWTQPVPLVRTKVGTPRLLDVAYGGRHHALVQMKDIYVNTVRPVERVAIEDAPMVFVGYGVTAPERGWDDFKGVDLKGKVAVFLVNDPDFEAKPGEPAAGRFGGKAMTFYGRWVYKYEEAARRGAVAALIVHDTPGAGYGWSTVTAAGGEDYDIVRDGPDQPVLLQGWIAGDAAVDLFRRAGLDLASLRVRARSPDFRPVTLGNALFSADIPVTSQRIESRNVIAKLTGAKRPDEAVMFGAHWDAYGIGVPDAGGRVVRPGANDDGLGIAGLLELARAFAAGPRPDRTLVFAAWTAEERGLLGSQTYALRPLYPLARTAANFTIDILETAGPARDVILVGPGQSSLEDDLAAAARAQGRVVTPESLPERGLFYRADHFPLARAGVPVLLQMGIAGPYDLVAGGRAAGEKWLAGYMACYHQTCDTWSPDWNLDGAAQDVALIYTIGNDLARSTRWPAWRATSEFRAVRERTADERR